MSDAGKRLIAAAKEARNLSVDDHMLQSMATAFRYNLAFSFNREDMADLLERILAERLLSKRKEQS